MRKIEDLQCFSPTAFQLRKEIKNTIDGIEVMMKKAIGMEVEENAEEKGENEDLKSELDADGEVVKLEPSGSQGSTSDVKREESAHPSQQLRSSSVPSEQRISGSPDAGMSSVNGQSEEDEEGEEGSVYVSADL
ncbi:MAG: hypothetical protein Q9223_004025 [Gallowayella weberi]